VLKRGERVIDGVERLRHRLRELDADAHRIRSAVTPRSGFARKSTRSPTGARRTSAP
jgi:hypothetical protein